MSITEATTIVVASDADGGLRISPTGLLTGDVVTSLHDAIHGGFRARAPRVEVDLRAVPVLDEEARRVLHAGERVAQHLGIEYRVTGDRPGLR